MLKAPKPNNPKAGVPVKPNLSKYAAAEWDRIVALMTEAGTLSRLDGRALQAFCTIVADLKEDWETVEREGKYQTDRYGALKAHPALARLDRLRGDLLKWASALGMTPTSRAKADSTNEMPGKQTLDDVLNG
jgi:P27 family predicted phage terminase small subunit